MKETVKYSILPQAESFLKDYLDIPISKIEESYCDDEFILNLKDYNSTLRVDGDSLHIVVIVCFETPLIDIVVKNFMSISEIDEDEKEELYLDATGEVMNIIVGLSNPKYIKKEQNAIMNTPKKIIGIRDIKIKKPYSVLQDNIYTEFGNMNISIIQNK